MPRNMQKFYSVYQQRLDGEQAALSLFFFFFFWPCLAGWAMMIKCKLPVGRKQQANNRQTTQRRRKRGTTHALRGRTFYPFGIQPPTSSVSC
ncbi:hypothetical protein I7I52_01585 [Histoplasma capsulatum]|uniref:Uncharacterized protein n=1 Tax=Ajellomyces capsulatus TaxID=5037 RepID=A0A8H8D6L6_AJECA|nr:hypothetical protein I7I52_01585 [Histoplasma capsulatum]